MTEVFFYITEKPASPAALAWRIAGKALRQKRQIYIHAGSDAAARELDELFWREPAGGFLPHALAGSEEAAGSPILIGHGDDPGDHHDVLINLAPAVPDFFSRFQRVAELVTGDENARKEARGRWKFYKDRGFPVQDHRLGG